MFARRQDAQVVEMQMGPMIDIVFLLLVFFMVTAKPVQPETDVGLQLPGTIAQEDVINLPNEVKIEIRSDETVIVNDASIGAPGDRALSELRKLLVRFRESSAANNLQPLVTIHAQDGARHQRVIDVMDSCAESGIHGVTFAPTDPES